VAREFSFLEFFAGGGMARLGLGEPWRCLFANDFDAQKCAAYRANFGGDDLVEADIASLGLGDLPARGQRHQSESASWWNCTNLIDFMAALEHNENKNSKV